MSAGTPVHHQSVGAQQAFRWNDNPDGDGLSGLEETGDRAEENQRGVDLPQVRGKNEPHYQDGADQIAADHGAFETPAVHENARGRADKRLGQHVGDENPADLGGGAVHFEGDDADYGQNRQEVAGETDKLRDGQLAETNVSQRVA